ncbi:MAG: hypothetical protein HY912_20165 [Desulfomonile tiedjei]|uniref:Condensation domain-containing protein n=1 Tax=Desulfomonile tiedjei TaxID=2358 RepID=A0A9D6V746_9BACT|nr:hypothetical protein [Desulfomonile tiedjei]
MRGENATENLSLLDGMAELMVLSNYGSAKNIILFGMGLEGQLDESAMQGALIKALDGFPHFLSGVRECRYMGSNRLMWSDQKDLVPVLQVSDLEIPDESLSFEDRLLAHLDGSLNKDWDLLRTVPTEFHVLHHSQGRHSFIGLVQHAAADAWTISRFIKRLLGGYHEIMSGQPPPWQSEGVRRHLPVKGRSKTDSELWRHLLFLIRKGLMPSIREQYFPKISHNGNGRAEHHIKVVLPTDESRNIINRAARENFTPLDVVIGGVNTAIDEWNRALYIPAGIITTGLTVQMRRRHGPTDAPVNSSAILLKSNPTQRADHASFGRFISVQRVSRFRSRMDVSISQAALSLAKAVRLLPLAMRRKAVHYFLGRPMCSVLVTWLGNGWSGAQGRRFTTDLLARKVGDLEVSEIHGIGHALALKAPIRVWGGLFRERFNLVFTLGGEHFTRPEAESFVERALRTVIENPFGCTSCD